MTSVSSAAWDLSHLHPSAQDAAHLPDEERLQHVRADRWIGYHCAADALARLETLLRWPRKQRMPNLLIVGPTNNGKSMIIEKFQRDHPRFAKDGAMTVPVLVMQTPSNPTLTRFYSAVLSALDTEVWPRAPAAELERRALADLEECSVGLLVLDELHNMLAGNTARRREFLNLLRHLGNALRIPLVGVGTHDAHLALRSDDQLENRFAPLVLPRWAPDEQARSLLASFAASFPLRRRSPITTPEMTRYLIERSEGTIGELATLLCQAATVAITTGEEAINATTLGQADYLGPTERRRAFTRALS
ncbi:TniB protein [Pseudonocardia ammonioxydans]|uniref:TniB protein n=1 Tax=Pseudonocardia ammonioxydans TaxID=260086 RepID=A0A1I5HSM6_PSUAM|nr:TniB protein [Pseudonocardia ammonioxydans]